MFALLLRRYFYKSIFISLFLAIPNFQSIVSQLVRELIMINFFKVSSLQVTTLLIMVFLVCQPTGAQTLSKADEEFLDTCTLKLARERGLILSPQLQLAYGECEGILREKKGGTARPSAAPAPQQSAQKFANMDQFIAPEICGAYANNPIAAEKQFKGKLIKIYGPVERIAVDGFGTPFLFLSGHPVRCKVRLNFPKNSKSSLEVLNKGQFITAVCKGSNKILNEVITDECRLL